ncbi:MAG: SDR family NAD(P)-dependent oxidoreductase [Halioglobus sp.]|nr:SDR family NAD(P)-dependent oxidoreductase [Halioglobus sp.]
MIVLHETAEVARPIGEVFAYVSDFTTTAEWDSTALRARQTTPGDVTVGTEFEVVCALPVGTVTLQYHVETLEIDDIIVLRGVCNFFHVTDTITFRKSGRQTKVDYKAMFTFSPAIRPLEGFFKVGMEKMGRKSVEGLACALEDQFPLSLPEREGREKLFPEVSLFTRLGYHFGRKRFHPMSASIKGQHIVITGSSAGLGYATAKALARRGAHLTLVMRDKAKADAAIEALQSSTGNKEIRYELADLSLMRDVESLVKKLRRRGHAIDVLINNAGALFNPRAETIEGLEKSFALLLLSPYRLTEGLKPLLKKATAPRVINIVSGGMYTQKLDVDTLQNDDGEKYSGSIAYAREKRALMVLTEEWARAWAEDGIVVNAMHPGWADTPGVQSALPEFRCVMRALLRSPEEGADTIVWLAAAREAGLVSGKLFLDREIRKTHLLKKTRESVAERSKLLDFLSDKADTTS